MGSSGFYKKDNKEIYVLDIDSMKYKLKNKIKYSSIEGAKKIDSLKEKISFILKQNDRASDLVKDIMIYACVYASNRLFEISNSLEDIDNCMKWGFNWSKGP